MDSPRPMVGSLLLVHEDPAIPIQAATALADLGCELAGAASLAEAVRLAGTGGPFTAVLLSAELLQHAGPTLAESLRLIRTTSGTDEIIVLIGRAPDLEFTSQAIREGIVGFARVQDGRCDVDALRRHVLTASQRHHDRRRRQNAFHGLDRFEEDGFIARSPLMSEVLVRAMKAAQISDVPVIVYGESGTGKQLLAETIHCLDPKRSGHRFLCVNCAAISGTLADSELFGHVKGAFTGATEDRQGHFRAAHGGTLLLDEIGELDRALQPKLLRVLQEGRVLPVGSDTEKDVDVRVIAATHRRLPVLVEQGAFRLDLYQRLNVIVLEIPALRDRPEDVPPLVQFFVKKYAGYCPTPIREVDPRLYEAFCRRPWAGNVRELENAIRQMLAFKTGGDRLDLADLQAIGGEPAEPAGEQELITQELVEIGRRLMIRGRVSLPELMAQLEHRLLSEAVRHSTGTTVDLAQRLGLSRRTFYNKLRKYRI